MYNVSSLTLKLSRFRCQFSHQDQRSWRKTKFNVPEEGDCGNLGQSQYC